MSASSNSKTVKTILPPLLHRGRSLSIRRTAPIDAALLFERMYHNPHFMHLFRLNDGADTEAQLRDRLAHRLTVSPQKSGYLELLAIHARHGPIGVGVLTDYSSFHGRAELLVGLFEEAHRHFSYGLEMGLLLGDLAFNQYGLHRLYAYSYGHNIYAQTILARMGFAAEGVMQEHVYDRDAKQFVDLHVFGLTEPHFRENARIARFSKRLVGRDITQPLSPPVRAEGVSETSPRPAYVASGAIAIGRNRSE
ncbi:MAG: GNAT family protein [Cyanobacteria bacterium J06639_1]